MVALVALALVPSTFLLARTGGAWWLARSMPADPGISRILVTGTPECRVLRDHANPGATRRMHHYSDATWHLRTLATGRLVLTVEGRAPMEVTPGQAVSLRGGVKHTSTNVAADTATIVGVFGIVPPVEPGLPAAGRDRS